MNSFFKNPINQVGIAILNLILAYWNIQLNSPLIGIVCAVCAGWGLRQACIPPEKPNE